MTTPTNDKYDLKRAHRELYAPSAKDFVVVDVPPMTYLAVDGSGDPNTSPEYADAIEALFSVAYAVKFRSKKALGRDFVVGPLEGLWRADDPAAFVTRDKASWSWTMLIAQPEWIDETLVTEAVAAVRAKGEKAALDRLRLERLHEGRRCRSCTSARTTTKRRRSPGFTMNGCRNTGSPSTETITRSTSATLAAPPPRSCARSCASRCGRPDARWPAPVNLWWHRRKRD